MTTLKGGLRKTVHRVKTEDSLIILPRLHRYLEQGASNKALPSHVVEKIAGDLTKPDRDRSSSFSPSQLSFCHRRQVFQFIGLPTPGKLDSDLQNLFLDGKWRHLRLQASMLDAEIIDRIEVPISMPAKRFTGSIDGAGEFKGYPWLLEIKGANSFTFDEIMHAGEPKPQHIVQGAGYFIGTGIPRVAFLYECKNTQRLKEFDINYQKEPWDAYVDEAEYWIDTLNEHVDDVTLPPPLSGDRAKRECPTCPFLPVCDISESEAWAHTSKKRTIKKVKKPASRRKPVQPRVRRDIPEEKKPWALRER